MDRFKEMADKLGAEKSVENKEIRMNVRVDEVLRDAFVASCKEKDTTAARELRAFMRQYVAQHGQTKLL